MVQETQEEVTEEVEAEVTTEDAAKAEAEKEIQSAFDEAVSDDQSDDEIKMKMIAAGAKFKNVTRLFNQYMIDAGLAISKDDKDKMVDKVCENQKLDEENVFNGCVADLFKNITGATERSASAWIRAYAKKNEVECYKKPKGEGVGRSGFSSKFADYISTSVGRTEDQVKAFIMGTDENEDTSDNVKKGISHFMTIYGTVELAVKNRAA